MVLVLALSALVVGAFGGLLGALLARFLPRAFLFSFWAALIAGAVFEFLHAGTHDEFERAGANVVVFGVLLPLLVGSIVTGSLVRRR